MSEPQTRSTDREPTPSLTYSNDEEPCVVCEMYPVDDEPTMTTNRSIFNGNRRYTIGAMCEAHDTEPVADLVEKAYEYAGTLFVAECVKHGVFTRDDALEHLSETEHERLLSDL